MKVGNIFEAILKDSDSIEFKVFTVNGMHDIGIFKSNYKALNQKLSWGHYPRPPSCVLQQQETINYLQLELINASQLHCVCGRYLDLA